MDSAAAMFDPVRLEESEPLNDRLRFPPGKNPYYIITPRFVRTSAGVKALHLLCHCLNRAGQEAYVLIYPESPLEDLTNPALLTPLITAEVIAAHQKRGVSPIVVYPETIPGNPLGAHSVVRYVLNFPGHLAGDKTYSPREIVFGYSSVLAAAGGAPSQVLFIPASNASLFTPGPPRERKGSCFCAMKYRLVHGGEPGPATAHAVEITRDTPESQQPEEIAELFRTCELFYTYENTALALEAALCLCPTVFLPNPWLTEVIAARELGMDGFAWGDDPAEIARAKATVHLARERYLATYPQFWEQLGVFVSVTQKRAVKDAVLGFPAKLAWRVRWRPKVEFAAAACRGAVMTFRKDGLAAVGRKTRRRLRFNFAFVLARVTVKVLLQEGPGAVVRKARPWLARGGRGVVNMLRVSRSHRLPPPGSS